MRVKTDNQARMTVAVVIGLVASVILTYLQMRGDIIYRDLSTVYPFFFNNFHALNAYQEFAWWMPEMNYGYPGYYFSMIGPVNIKSPIFMLFGSVAYIFGKMDFQLSNIFLFYQIYIGIALPLALVISTFLLARLMFRDKKVIYFITILAAFSPVVIMNLGDPGNIEPLAFDILWTFAFLTYLRRPCKKQFLVLGLASGFILLTLGYSFITWGPIYFPLLLICCLTPLRGAKRVVAALRVMPRSAWGALLLLCILCATPAMLAMREGKDFKSMRASDLTYPYAELKTGNPLEALTASTPGVYFNWNDYAPDPRGSGSNQFLPIRSQFGDAGYTYLGLPVLALAALGLLYGRRSLRTRLMIMGMGVFMVGILSGFSPLFSMILYWNTSLRSFNHFSDLLYRGGGCMILIFMAGLGLETLLKRRNILGPVLLRFLGISVIISLAFIFYVYQGNASILGANFGFFLVTAIFTGIAFFHLVRAPGRVALRRSYLLLLAVLLLDLSTVSFGFVRSRIAVHEPLPGLNSGGPQTVGMVSTHPAFEGVAKYLVEYRVMSELGLGILSSGRMEEILSKSSLATKRNEIESKQYSIQFAYSALMSSLAKLTVYRRVQFVGGANSETFSSQWAATFTGEELDRILPVAAADEKAWREAAGRPRLPIKLGPEEQVGEPIISKQTYLNMVFHGVSDSPGGAVLIRMPWHRYWSATVNGEAVPVARAAAGLSAVPVPLGRYEVVLHFDPVRVRFALMGAYGALFFWCLVPLVRRWRRQERAN